MEIKPFKIRDLTPEKSKIVQETLFKNGYRWSGSGTVIQNYKDMHLYTDGKMYSGIVSSVPKLTFEEFERLYVKEEFVLPEKWRLKRNVENEKFINNWRQTVRPKAGKLHEPYINQEAYGVSERYGEEITFDQFKKYVLKEGVKDENLGGIEVGVGYVYNLKQDKWAEIIQDTLKVEDLVKGEIYFHKCTYDYIIKFDSLGYKGQIKGSYYIEPQVGGFGRGYANTSIDELRVATQEEKQWLEACILANKFIPKEEALKSKKMKFEIGKWYKAIDGKSKITSKLYVKNKFENDGLDSFRETICAGEYQKGNANLGYIGTYNYVEIPLSEIQQYLPEGHPDKFIQVEYHGLTSKNHLENAFNQSISSKKKSYIPIYTEPTTVKNVENEITLIRKVNKVKIIKINNYGN